MAEKQWTSPAPSQPHAPRLQNRALSFEEAPKRGVTFGPKIGVPDRDEHPKSSEKRRIGEPFPPHLGELQTALRSVHPRHPKRPRGEPFPHLGELQTALRNAQITPSWTLCAAAARRRAGTALAALPGILLLSLLDTL